jgi:hypothetical protein
VPQEGALFPHLSVAGNVAFGLDAQRGARERTEEMLELVGLSGFGRRLPQELSGGQQQRVALARALAPQPRFLLLDEPFSSLDAGLRTELREDVVRVLRVSGATALLVTHDQAEAMSMADLVAVMRDGRIAQVGEPREVYARPADLDVALLLGDVIVLDTPSAGELRCCGVELGWIGDETTVPTRSLTRRWRFSGRNRCRCGRSPRTRAKEPMRSSPTSTSTATMRPCCWNLSTRRGARSSATPAACGPGPMGRRRSAAALACASTSTAPPRSSAATPSPSGGAGAYHPSRTPAGSHKPTQRSPDKPPTLQRSLDPRRRNYPHKAPVTWRPGSSGAGKATPEGDDFAASPGSISAAGQTGPGVVQVFVGVVVVR